MLINKKLALGLILISILLYVFYSISVDSNSPLEEEISLENSNPKSSEHGNNTTIHQPNNNIKKNSLKQNNLSKAKQNTNNQPSNLKESPVFYGEIEIPEELRQEYEEDKKLREQAYGYIDQIKDWDETFENDEFDSEWSAKMLNNINEQVLYTNGNNNFSALQVEDLDCKKLLCRIEFSRVTDDIAQWDDQRSGLMYALMKLGSKPDARENHLDRALKSQFLDNGNIRYYITRGKSDLTP